MTLAEQRIADLDRLVMPLVRDMMLSAKTPGEKAEARKRVNQALDERLAMMRCRDEEKGRQ